VHLLGRAAIALHTDLPPELERVTTALLPTPLKVGFVWLKKARDRWMRTVFGEHLR
jgi:hypothetical protein